MTPLTKYLAYSPHPQTAGDVILWWESRRLIYNGIIFAAILVSALWLAAVMQPKRLTEYLSRTGTLVATALSVLQIPANVWYTGGWVADLVVKRVLRLSAAGFAPLGPGRWNHLFSAFYWLIRDGCFCREEFESR